MEVNMKKQPIKEYGMLENVRVRVQWRGQMEVALPGSGKMTKDQMEKWDFRMERYTKVHS